MLEKWNGVARYCPILRASMNTHKIMGHRDIQFTEYECKTLIMDCW